MKSIINSIQKHLSRQTAAPGTQIESPIIELSTLAFETFCEDTSRMFSVNAICSWQETCPGTLKGVKKHFKKPASVNYVKAEGILNGTFRFIFDQRGLFILGGIIAATPEEKILQNIKRCSLKNAEEITDAVVETGNLLVASWDKAFRRELAEHGYFLRTDTFIGDPFRKSKKTIGPAEDEMLVCVLYEIKIAAYPAFKCGVLLPKTFLDVIPESDSEQSACAKEKIREGVNSPQETEIKKDEPICKKCGGRHWPFQLCSKDVTGTADGIAEEKLVSTNEPENSSDGTVSQTIQRMTQSPPVLPGEQTSPAATAENPPSDNTGRYRSILAKDIMRKDVAWCGSEETVQSAIAKMQQFNTDYMLVGQNGTPEAIVSKSDLAGAVSPYLRPEFSKWRRPLDDATLKIKVKWIMARPIHTIEPHTTLTDIMDNICRFGCRCLPVADQQGKVQGMVTVFDIFNALSDHNQSEEASGKDAI